MLEFPVSCVQLISMFVACVINICVETNNYAVSSMNFNCWILTVFLLIVIVNCFCNEVHVICETSYNKVSENVSLTRMSQDYLKYNMRDIVLTDPIPQKCSSPFQCHMKICNMYHRLVV